MSTDRLRSLISECPGSTWNDKVIKFAEINGRSASSVYRWLSAGPPSNILDAIEYRLTRPNH